MRIRVEQPVEIAVRRSPTLNQVLETVPGLVQQFAIQPTEAESRQIYGLLLSGAVEAGAFTVDAEAYFPIEGSGVNESWMEPIAQVLICQLPVVAPTPRSAEHLVVECTRD